MVNIVLILVLDIEKVDRHPKMDSNKTLWLSLDFFSTPLPLEHQPLWLGLLCSQPFGRTDLLSVRDPVPSRINP